MGTVRPRLQTHQHEGFHRPPRAPGLPRENTGALSSQRLSELPLPQSLTLPTDFTEQGVSLAILSLTLLHTQLPTLPMLPLLMLPLPTMPLLSTLPQPMLPLLSTPP